MLYAIWKRIVATICRRKRRQRKAELRHLIAMIRDKRGCSHALNLCAECRHISQHYLIPFSAVGFEGDFWELWEETGKSLSRYDHEQELLSRLERRLELRTT